MGVIQGLGFKGRHVSVFITKTSLKLQVETSGSCS